MFLLIEEEDIPIFELQHNSPPLFLPTDSYSTLLASVNQLTLSHNQLCDDFYSTAAHFAPSQRLVEQHFTQIQYHLSYKIPPPSQYIHPFPPTYPPFPPYDP